jgi:hypothetical protein
MYPDFSSSPLMEFFCSAVVLYWIVWSMYTTTLHPLAKYPGPRLASLSRLWLMLDIASGNLDETQRRLYAKHGQQYTRWSSENAEPDLC